MRWRFDLMSWVIGKCALLAFGLAKFGCGVARFGIGAITIAMPPQHQRQAADLGASLLHQEAEQLREDIYRRARQLQPLP